MRYLLFVFLVGCGAESTEHWGGTGIPSALPKEERCPMDACMDACSENVMTCFSRCYREMLQCLDGDE